MIKYYIYFTLAKVVAQTHLSHWIW